VCKKGIIPDNGIVLKWVSCRVPFSLSHKKELTRQLYLFIWGSWTLVHFLNHACGHIWYKRNLYATHLRVTRGLPFVQRIFLRRPLIKHPFLPHMLFRYHAQLVYQILRGSHIWHRSLETTSQPDASWRHRFRATPDFESEDARQVSVNPISKLFSISVYGGLLTRVCTVQRWRDRCGYPKSLLSEISGSSDAQFLNQDTKTNLVKN